jgi:hypothetical protein
LGHGSSTTSFSTPMFAGGTTSWPTNPPLATSYGLRYGVTSSGTSGVLYGVTNYNGVWTGSLQVSAPLGS